MTTALTATTLQGAYGTYGAGGAAITFAAGDVTGSTFALTDGDVVLAYNSGGIAYTVTIASLGFYDITAYSVGAGEVAAFGPFKAPGWRPASGLLTVTVSNAAVKLAVLKQQ